MDENQTMSINYNPNTQFVIRCRGSIFVIEKCRVCSYDVHRDFGGMELKLHADGFDLSTSGNDAVYNFIALTEAFPNFKENNNGVSINDGININD